MGTPWCAGLPVVTLARRDTPTPVTLVYSYYEHPCFLATQITGWWQWPRDLWPHVSLILVDDGSPEHPAADVVRTLPAPFACRVFRIHEDRRWNWLAARNIGMHHAPEGWALLTDMDHVVPAATLRALVYGDYDPQTVYAFARVEHTGQALLPHSASFLLTRARFWQVGGYDEALSGYYGTDGDWRRRLAAVAPLAILPERLVRCEGVSDASTQRYGRKEPQDAAVRRIVASRGAHWTPKTLTFPHHEEAL